MKSFTEGLIQDALVATGEEMFIALARTAMSSIIYETLDFAVGLTDADGELLTQGNGVTLFLATLDTTVKEIIERNAENSAIHDGDIFLANSPYGGGGTHLSDVSVVMPVFFDDELVAWTVNKAHWTEVGGMVPGSICTTADEIYQEGLQFPYIKVIDQGRLNKSIVELVRANVRLPDMTVGDMWAGIAAARVGARRVTELMSKYGKDTVRRAMSGSLDYGERMTRIEIARIPDGVYTAEDVIESDGRGNGPFSMKVQIEIRGDEMIADFTGTDSAAPGPINSAFTSLQCAARTLFKALTNPEIPANGGSFRPLTVICPPGTMLSANSPSPTSIYYESCTAAIDLMWKAMAPVVPERLSAGHLRSICATFLSGHHPDTGELFIFGEPLVGGWGAGRNADGQNGQFCCGDGETYNIPVELTEARYGILVDQYAFHTEDGGAGRHRGGKGVVLDYRVVADEAFLTVTFSRDKYPPWGLDGGCDGTPNYVEILRTDSPPERCAMATLLRLRHGDVARLVTATGGGYGDPADRPRESVMRDVTNGYITAAQAARHYGFDVAEAT